MTQPESDNALVRYSRAGDAFHYRWAARRCLKLIDFRSAVNSINIESSKESKAAGEYVIDLAEYSKKQSGQKSVNYCQLKHSTVRISKPFGYSEVKSTLSGFAARYAACIIDKRANYAKGAITFSFISNRPVSVRIKAAVESIRAGLPIKGKLQRDMQRITKLKGEQLREFYQSLTFLDGEADYLVQKTILQGEMAEYLAGFVDSTEVDSLIALVANRALPKSDDGKKIGEIRREDVLQRLGVTSERDLFPAPIKFENLPQIIKREQHEVILQHVLQDGHPSLVHATGGVGKSVVTRQISDSLPPGSIAIIYDCFDSGRYRNPSDPRHRAQDALVQMANELAAKGLCRPLLCRLGTQPDRLFRGFQERLQQALQTLREINPKAVVVVLVDAADNAEMVANENNEKSFAKALLREAFPDGCYLAMFCRTERRYLLAPSGHVRQFLLADFSKAESAAHLRRYFPAASNQDVLEFHRLSGGNPRVQANALNVPGQDLRSVLTNLGPTKTTVDDQIYVQLQTAVIGIKDRLGPDFQRQVDGICRGLANLPPFIPLEVLAKAAGVQIEDIKSFVSDLGRPLWHSDDSIQFRDEPTEFWFRNTFSASKEQIAEYITALEPLAGQYSYVSRVLPQLLMRSQNYQKLVDLALSNDFLPANNPVDARNIRVYRLQYAFKAALKMGRLADATRLAFRAGEEVAGDKRQLELLQTNIDLIAPLQNPGRVEELAHRQVFEAGWDGSQNLFSAALLSSVKDFHGEAGSFLRASERWVRIYFDARDQYHKTHPPNFPFPQQLTNAHICELAWTHWNLYGPEQAAKFIMSWRPPTVIFQVARQLIKRLATAGNYDNIDRVARAGAKNPYLILALSEELATLAKFPPRETLGPTLDFLADPKKRIAKPNYVSFDDPIPGAILAVLEACAANGMAGTKILECLAFYAETDAGRNISNDFNRAARTAFFRSTALKAVLAGELNPNPQSLLPLPDPKRQPGYSPDHAELELSRIVKCFLPWYVVRARFIVTEPTVDNVDLSKLFTTAEDDLEQGYRTKNHINFEIGTVYFQVLALKKAVTGAELDSFAQNVARKIKPKIMLGDSLHATFVTFRLPHLAGLRQHFEDNCRNEIEAHGTEGPEARSQSFIDLARSVFAVSPADASAYFNQAIEAVSKFGDEMVQRWNAIVAVAKRAGKDSKPLPELCYRFMQCAEVVGETVAREKHWNRNEVFRTAIHLDCPGTFSVLSRWRDRNVGWFGEQLRALAKEAINSDILNPTSGWCLSAFKGCNGNPGFAAACIAKEKDRAKQQRFLDSTVRDGLLQGIHTDNWEELQALAEKLGLKHDNIPKWTAKSFRNHQLPDLPKPVAPVQPAKKTDWDVIFKNVDLTNMDGLNAVVATFAGNEFDSPVDELWQQLFSRVSPGKEVEFLNQLVVNESIDLHDIERAIVMVAHGWSKKASVKQHWPTILKNIGRRFSQRLANDYHLESWCSNRFLNPIEAELVRVAAFEALADSHDSIDAETFFGFAEQFSSRLTQQEAEQLLDFALARFEMHIPEEFGDGRWSDWAKTDGDALEGVTGLIWAALGSPYSSERWQAAHCVRRFAENSCQHEIDGLINWMVKGSVGAFGCQRFAFYDLHAKLYLLIAFVRTSLDDTQVIRKHARIFADLALKGLPHLLIQKTAAEISLQIEGQFPGTYPSVTVRKLKKVGKSPFLPKIVKRNSDSQVTPWHANGSINAKLKLHFSWDFDRYWFEPLGRLFGVPQDQVIELARDIAVKELNVSESEEHWRDARQQQWASLENHGKRGTWHDHGSYPRIDNYSFYYSYHSLLVAASKLTSKMPVIHESGYGSDADELAAWLRWHWLARPDGRWLADRRDPLPVKRRNWLESQVTNDCLWEVNGEDFFDALAEQCALPGFLCVDGNWTDHSGSFIETISISSAMVNPESAGALASAMRTSDGPFSLYFLRSPHHDMDFTRPPFELTPWTQPPGETSGQLDTFDPYARDIRYPSYALPGPIAKLLRLTADAENRQWTKPTATNPSVISELWSNKEVPESRDWEEPYRSGSRLSASVELLKELCVKTGKSLIVAVHIRRSELRRHRSSDEPDLGYIQPSHKVFIFSSNGTLQDARKNHQLG